MSNGNQPIRPTRKLTGGLVNSSLLVANPTQTGMNLNTAPQNMPGMFLNLSVNDIDFFDKNPPPPTRRGTVRTNQSLYPRIGRAAPRACDPSSRFQQVHTGTRR